MLEDLLGLGATIVVLDPNSDVRPAAQGDRRRERPLPPGAPHRARRADRALPRPRIQNRRYSGGPGGPLRMTTPSASRTWRRRTSADVAGVPQNAERIREAVANACARLRQRHVDFDPTDLARSWPASPACPLDDVDPALLEATTPPASRARGATTPRPTAHVPIRETSGPCRSRLPGRRTATTSTPPASASTAPEAPDGAPGWGLTAPAGGARRGARAPARRTRCRPPAWPCVTSRS